MVNDHPPAEACALCGGNDVLRIRDYRATSETFRGLGIGQCRACGLVAASPMPNPEALVSYNATYWRSAHGRSSVASDRLAHAFQSGVAQVRCALLMEYASRNGVKPERVLEFGPGEGDLARRFIRANPGVEYALVESDTSLHSHLTSLGTSILDQSNRDALIGYFDCVILSHVLEHVASPSEILAEASRLLRGGGVLFIDVPCRDDLHKPTDEPHVIFFDRETLRRFVVQHPLVNVELRYFGIPIDELVKKKSFVAKVRERIRGGLIRRGLTHYFGRSAGLEMVEMPLERAVIRPFAPQIEREQAAWWMRAFAVRAERSDVP